jgi:hypothetical protein
MKNTILLSMFIALLFACKPTSNQIETALTAPSTENTFGEAVTADNAIAINDLFAQLSHQDSMVTKVRGTVQEVCQAKGCWMSLSDGSTEAKTVFVKFKDYGFFVPKDISGKEVIMEGVAFQEVTSIDELKHYAQDKGATEEEIAKITEPKREYKFMASGVLLLNK